MAAHWLAVEGVQPSIPQNPTPADSRNQELVPRGPNANLTLAAMSGNDNVTVKPLVKHVLSKELQMYFEKICSALLDDSNTDYRVAALASIRSDPGLHQLVPYLVQFIAEKVTHDLKSIFVLTQMMHLTSAMLENENLHIDPYVCSDSNKQTSLPLICSAGCLSYPTYFDMPCRSTFRQFSGTHGFIPTPPSCRLSDIGSHQKV